MGLPLRVGRGRESVRLDVGDALAVWAYQLPDAGCVYGVAAASVCADGSDFVDYFQCYVNYLAV